MLHFDGFPHHQISFSTGEGEKEKTPHNFALGVPASEEDEEVFGNFGLNGDEAMVEPGLQREGLPSGSFLL